MLNRGESRLEAGGGQLLDRGECRFEAGWRLTELFRDKTATDAGLLIKLLVQPSDHLSIALQVIRSLFEFLPCVGKLIIQILSFKIFLIVFSLQFMHQPALVVQLFLPLLDLLLLLQDDCALKLYTLFLGFLLVFHLLHYFLRVFYFRFTLQELIVHFVRFRSLICQCLFRLITLLLGSLKKCPRLGIK